MCLPPFGACPFLVIPRLEQTLARKPNYDFEKRRKELERKKKKEEKLLRKRETSAREVEERANVTANENGNPAAEETPGG